VVLGLLLVRCKVGLRGGGREREEKGKRRGGEKGMQLEGKGK
jgi:hypothetical protein